jgi:hypothetical protein
MPTSQEWDSNEGLCPVFGKASEGHPRHLGPNRGSLGAVDEIPGWHVPCSFSGRVQQRWPTSISQNPWLRFLD